MEASEHMKLQARKRQGPTRITTEDKNEKTMKETKMKEKEASAAALATITRMDQDFNEYFK
jgi:hypothetical protein